MKSDQIKKPKIIIEEPGLLSTIQDLGRFEYQKYGVPTSGALDSLAFQIGNILLGNSYENPGIETTMIGPTIKFESNMWICITGAQSSPILDGKEIQMWKPIYVKENSILKWGSLNWGIRSYILFKMEMEIEKTMNSYSANTGLAIGGHNDGLPLKKGDKIKLINSNSSIPHLNNNFDYTKHYIQEENDITLRIILGPHDDYFNQNEIDKFLSSEYQITPQSNRIGYRLSGSQIKHIDKSDIISEGGSLGSIQIPGEGQPIILLQDRGTTGGYPKIATIATVDIPKLAQAQPGQIIKFKKIDIEESISLLRSNNQILHNLNYNYNTKHYINIENSDKEITIFDKNKNKIASTETHSEIQEFKSYNLNAKYKKKKYSFKINIG